MGYWGGTPGQFPAARHGYAEISHVIVGNATLHTDGSASIPLRAGDTVVTSSGSRGSWEIHETLPEVWVAI